MAHYNVWKFWPLLVWIVIMYVLNPDYAVVGMAAFSELSPFEIGVKVAPFAFGEMVFSYWCWGRCRREIEEMSQIREIRRMRNMENWFTDGMLVGCVQGMHQQVTDPNRFLTRWGKWWKPIVFLLSMLPLPGPRMIGTVYYGFQKSPWGLVSMLAANAIHIFSGAYTLRAIFSLFY